MESSGPYLGTACTLHRGIVFDEFFDRSGSAEAEPEGQRGPTGFCHGEGQLMGFCHGFATVGAVLARLGQAGRYRKLRKWFKIKEAQNVGA